MAYNPFYAGGWKDYPNTSTPITSAALNHMEEGIAAAGEGAGGEVFVKTVGSQSGNYCYDIFKCNIGNAAAIEAGKDYYYILRGWCKCKSIDAVQPNKDVTSAIFDFDFPGIESDIPDAMYMWYDWGIAEPGARTYWYSSLNYAHLGSTNSDGYCEKSVPEPRNCLAGFYMAIYSQGTGALGTYFGCEAKAFLPNFAGASTFSFLTEDISNLTMFFELRLEAVRETGRG